MTRTVANVLSTALYRTYHFPVFKPSRRDVRNLFDALEDLVLPMGSFPSEELQPWAPIDPTYDSNPTASPLSTTPSLGSTGFELDGESPPPKPTLVDEHLSMAPPTESTLPNVEPKSTVMRSSALPKRNDSGSAASTKSASIGRTPMGGPSNAALKSTLVTATHGHHAKVPRLERTVVQTNTLGSGSIAVCEKGQKEQQDEDSTAVMKEVITGTQTAEQQDGVSTAAVEEVSAGTLALFKSSVRKLVDPEGTSGPDLHQLVQLVADIMKQRTEAKENLISETLRSKRAEEDLRHLWEVMAGVFERTISEQNKALQSSRNENHELTEENRKLKLEHSVDEDKRNDTLDQFNDRLRTLKAEKEFAEETAKTAKAAKAELEDRINVVRDAKSAAEDKHADERKSLISSKIYVRSGRSQARRQLTDAVEEHQVAIKEKDQVIEGLEATLKEIRSTVTTSEELAASDKRQLEKQLEDQRQEKDREIDNLTDQLRESKAEARSLSGWKDKAEAEKQNRKRLSKLLEDEKTRLLEAKKNIVDQKNLDIRDLERTIKTNEAEISRLKGMITSLEAGEAGEEMEGLKSGLEESKKQLQVSAKNMQDVKQQLQNRQDEIAKLKDTVKARDKNISEEAKKKSKAKEDLKQLEQTTRVSKQGLEEKVRELGEQKDELSRELEVAQNAERTVRADMQRLHDENGQTAAEHERMIMERNEEIHRLQSNEQNYENHNKTAVKDAVGEVMEKAKGKIGELERDKVAIEQAAGGAVETLQKQLDEERRSSREAKEKATKTENELRNEMDILKSQVNDVEKSHSTDPAGSEVGKDAQIAEELVTQANDANSLLLEIGENGLAKKSVEQTVLRQLNDAKIALHRVKGVLLEPPARYHRGRLVKILDGVHVNEERIAQLPIDSALVSQAKMANARLLRLEKILDANADVQRDAMLEALHTATPFERKIMKPRALRRPAKASPPLKPSTAGQTDVSMGQSQQTSGAPEQQYNPPIFNLQQSAQTNGAPEQQYNPPIFNLQQSAQPHIQAAAPQIKIQDFGQTQPGGSTNGHGFQPNAKVAFDFTSVGDAPASSANPLLQPFAMVDTGTGGPSTPKNNNQNGISTDKMMVVNRDHRPPFMDLLNSLKPAAHNMASGAMPMANAPSPVPNLQGGRQASASVDNSKKNQIPQMPKGWTDEMTGTVRGMRGEDYLFISEMVKELHDLQVKDPEGLEKWINKLQADHEAEMNPNLDPALGQFSPNA